MRFFLSFMLAGFLLCLYFLLTDDDGSGMGWGVALFAALGLGVAFYNYLRFENMFNEGPQ